MGANRGKGKKGDEDEEKPSTQLGQSEGKQSKGRPKHAFSDAEDAVMDTSNGVADLPAEQSRDDAAQGAAGETVRRSARAAKRPVKFSPGSLLKKSKNLGDRDDSDFEDYGSDVEPPAKGSNKRVCQDEDEEYHAGRQKSADKARSSRAKQPPRTTLEQEAAEEDQRQTVKGVKQEAKGDVQTSGKPVAKPPDKGKMLEQSTVQEQEQREPLNLAAGRPKRKFDELQQEAKEATTPSKPVKREASELPSRKEQPGGKGPAKEGGSGAASQEAYENVKKLEEAFKKYQAKLQEAEAAAGSVKAAVESWRGQRVSVTFLKETGIGALFTNIGKRREDLLNEAAEACLEIKNEWKAQVDVELKNVELKKNPSAASSATGSQRTEANVQRAGSRPAAPTDRSRPAVSGNRPQPLPHQPQQPERAKTTKDSEQPGLKPAALAEVARADAWRTAGPSRPVQARPPASSTEPMALTSSKQLENWTVVVKFKSTGDAIRDKGVQIMVQALTPTQKVSPVIAALALEKDIFKASKNNCGVNYKQRLRRACQLLSSTSEGSSGLRDSILAGSVGLVDLWKTVSTSNQPEGETRVAAELSSAPIDGPQKAGGPALQDHPADSSTGVETQRQQMTEEPETVHTHPENARKVVVGGPMACDGAPMAAQVGQGQETSAPETQGQAAVAMEVCSTVDLAAPVPEQAGLRV